ncbi:unnamed protein product [Closterium sp. Yama58-4]|nr:unnamed protein product [Closterium sp. Yama58-4]
MSQIASPRGCASSPDSTERPAVASSRREAFSWRPAQNEWTSFSPQERADGLKRLSDSIPNPSFAVESVASYRLLDSLYKPADHALVVLGSVHSSAPGAAESGSDKNGGRFLTFWDQILPSEDAYNEDCSKWGLSWLMWQTRDANGLPAKRVPFTANVSVDSVDSAVSAGTSVSPDLGTAATASEQPAAELANDVTPDALRMDNDFGHLDEVKSAQSGNEEATNEDKQQTLGKNEEPRQSDVIFYVQTAWSAFVSALAADDVASASSILFGPEAVTLMAPGADSVTLATEQEKANLIDELKASHVSLSVMVEEVALLQGSETKQGSGLTISALVRSTYSVANAQGIDVEHGKRVELWRASATNGREWHLSWSMWNGNGHVLTKEEALHPEWGVSWLMWQNRGTKDQPKRVPFTVSISADSVVPPDGAAELSAAAQAATTDVPDVLMMDKDFGHLDAVKVAQSQNEEVKTQPAVASSENQEAKKEPQQADVHFNVQTAWSAFVSALAADDVASASSILFGPEVVTLMAPGAESVTLATELEKANLLNEFKGSHLSLSVMVGEVEVLQDEGSKSFAALTRSTYTIADAQGVEIEHGKRVELWRPSGTNGGGWHLVWSMCNDNGPVLSREEAMAAYQNDKFVRQDDPVTSNS